ncbi:hypothetical protein [Escherichia coli]|nr:hypothetical protein [Escherichia coli]OSL71404.1 hypothetical protein EAYG_04347 [Escherichia coli TA014]
MTIFYFFERSVKTGCTGRADQMPKYPHRNRVTHLLILIIFSSRHISDEMSVKIELSINLSPVAAAADLLAITALSG